MRLYRQISPASVGLGLARARSAAAPRSAQPGADRGWHDRAGGEGTHARAAGAADASRTGAELVRPAPGEDLRPGTVDDVLGLVEHAGRAPVIESGGPESVGDSVP
jgi:hypothetical protein